MRGCIFSLEKTLKLLIDYACEAGRIANRTSLSWTAGTEDIGTSGTQFIFSYELARLLHENREPLGLVRIEFDKALAEVRALGGGRPPSRVSRNTRRQYMILHQACGARQIIRAQQYYNEGLVTSEAKGLVSALFNYPKIEAAILVGIAVWRGANDPAQFLLERRDVLAREFVGIIDTAFTWPNEPETGPFVFAISCWRGETAG